MEKDMAAFLWAVVLLATSEQVATEELVYLRRLMCGRSCHNLTSFASSDFAHVNSCTSGMGLEDLHAGSLILPLCPLEGGVTTLISIPQASGNSKRAPHTQQMPLTLPPSS